jgi:broad specificity phosphatase PhoE
MKIFIIRHGTTKLNQQDRIRGWSNPLLSEKGMKEVDETGREMMDKDIDIIVSSDLTRAEQTAEAIKRHTGARMETTEKLRPWDVGKFTGQESKDVHPQLKIYAKTPNRTLPEGESLNDFKKRFFEGLREIISKYGNENIALVTHHRGERLIKAWQAMGEPKDKSIDLNVFFQHGEPPANAEEIEIDESKLQGGLLDKALTKVKSKKKL